MSRSSLRIKNYRPISAEISSKPSSALGTMFTIGPDPNEKSPEKNSGITLLNCKLTCFTLLGYLGWLHSYMTMDEVCDLYFLDMRSFGSFSRFSLNGSYCNRLRET